MTSAWPHCEGIKNGSDACLRDEFVHSVIKLIELTLKEMAGSLNDPQLLRFFQSLEETSQIGNRSILIKSTLNEQFRLVAPRNSAEGVLRYRGSRGDES